MAHITHEVPHGLDLERAKQAARLALDDYLRRFGERVSARWVTDSRAEVRVSVKGAHIEATVDVLPAVLRIEARVPLLLKAFKSVAVAKIDSEAAHWIEQARSGSAV
jgi:Putative polyhydroxyalkanoic acid system protein (PHA_gran_rgn)